MPMTKTETKASVSERKRNIGNRQKTDGLRKRNKAGLEEKTQTYCAL